MSRRLRNLDGDNSAQIHQIAGSAATNVTDISNITKHVPPVFQNGGGGFVLSNYRWQVAISDASAFMYYYFVCPQTRADWKFVLVYNNQFNTNDVSGLLRVAAMAHDDTWDDNSEINDDNFDLAVATQSDVYFKESAAFSATLGDIIGVRWNKDANNGAGTIYILGAYITHA